MKLREIRGWYGSYSFASFDPNERDIFIECIYKKGKKGVYKDNPGSQGVFIAKDQIKFIEFRN
ncbi:MAG: DUF6338 family protein [Deltaproteobacteria bacterium]|nr:DUF6338 family protein [Deltaproteobacteria bacterium]